MTKVLMYILFILSIVVVVPVVVLRGYTNREVADGAPICYKCISIYNAKEDKIVYMPMEE